jgi:ABC-2 type transport system permease protein
MVIHCLNCVSQNLFRFGDKYIIGGQFDRVLLRPLSSIAQVLFESFNLDSIGTFILGLVVLVRSSNNLGIIFTINDYLWLFFSVISGAIILVSVFISLASLSFHFEDKLGVGAPVYGLINFGRYPVNIFNKTVQFVLSFVIPFAFVAFYPATHFFNKSGFEFYCYLTPVVALVSFMISLFFWGYGTKKYTSTGF